jgi:glycosyltransferase involved in cell wall biosynthesis
MKGRYPPVHFAVDLSLATSFTWITVDLIMALQEIGAAVSLTTTGLSDSIEPRYRRALPPLMKVQRPGVCSIGWAHYWAPYQIMRPTGKGAMTFVALNHLLAAPFGEPSDAWMQQVAADPAWKLAISNFCGHTLLQNGIDSRRIRVINLGYTPEVDFVGEAAELDTDRHFRFLTVTNSSDPVRFGTDLVIQAYAQEFAAKDDVCLVIKDYNPTSRRILEYLDRCRPRAPYLYLAEFTSRERMVGLYRACQAFVSAARGEGFGIKVLDALACGLPVVVPVFGGLRDFCVDPGVYPVDYRYGSADECVDVAALRTKGEPVWCQARMTSIRQRMREVFENAEEAKRNGQQAARFVREHFGWRQVGLKLLSTVEEVLSYE